MTEGISGLVEVYFDTETIHFTLNRILYFQSLEDIHCWSPLHNKGRKGCNVSTKKGDRKVLTERWVYPPRLFTKKDTLTDAFFPAP